MNTTPATTSTGEPAQDLCPNGTDFGCGPNGPFGSERDVTDDFLEQEFDYGLRLWHIIFLATGTVLSLVILLCCCIKFRIPRTKQEIEADYIRRKILRKFRSRLKAIQNQELDEMDLKCALDKIRAEFKSDTESLAQSEAGFSVGTISSSVLAGEKGHNSSTYRRASQIANEISLEDLRAHSMGVAGRLSLAFSKFFGRSKVGQTSSTPTAKGAEKPKAPQPPPPPLPSKSKNEALEQKQTTITVDETKKNPKQSKESNKKEKPSKTKDTNESKTSQQKPEIKVKEQQKPTPKVTKAEKQTEVTKKSKSAKDASTTVVEIPPEGPLKQGKVQDKNCSKETAKQKKELEKEKKRAKEQLEKEKKEQAKREKMGGEKEKLEKAKQEKEKEKMEKQKKEREKQEKETQEKEAKKREREKQEKESKKQKGKSEKESNKLKDGK